MNGGLGANCRNCLEMSKKGLEVISVETHMIQYQLGLKAKMHSAIHHLNTAQKYNFGIFGKASAMNKIIHKFIISLFIYCQRFFLIYILFKRTKAANRNMEKLTNQ